MRHMPRRAREIPETPATRELAIAVDAFNQAEDRLRRAIIEAAREAATPGSKLTYAEIARRSDYSREYVSRLASGAGIKQREKPE
jgi:CRP-like cAMP-binding protein